jgi:hypothetical protein
MKELVRRYESRGRNNDSRDGRLEGIRFKTHYIVIPSEIDLVPSSSVSSLFPLLSRFLLQALSYG